MCVCESERHKIESLDSSELIVYVTVRFMLD